MYPLVASTTTYPGRLATADLPPLDFPPPDTALLPRSSYISEFGRRFAYRYSGSRGTTPPTLAAPLPAPAPVVTPTTDAGPTPTTPPTPPTAAGGSPPTTGPGP